MSLVTIKCVAMRLPDVGKILTALPPKRHHDLFQVGKAIGLLFAEMHPNEQGFLTSKDVFVDRKEGCKIARAADQIKTKHGAPDVLYSEDMW